ncbi:MAG: DUF819 family protein [Bacteroidales bacterium]
MIKIVLLLLFYFTFPLIIIYLCKRWSFFKKLGTLAVAYGFGLLLGTSGILPEGSASYMKALQGRAALPGEEMKVLLTSGQITEHDVYVNKIAASQDMMISIIVPLAFPLLLFSLNFKRWLKFAKEGMFSMILALVSIIFIICTGYLIFKNLVPDSWKVAGMLVGVYTGGTPNMASLKVAMEVDPNLFLMSNSYDILMGAVTLIFFITAGPKVFRAILPPFNKDKVPIAEDDLGVESESFDDFTGILVSRKLIPLLKALGMSVLIFALSFGVSTLLPGLPQSVVVILGITTLAIAASFIKWLNRVDKSFQLGMYLIVVFSFAVASMSNLKLIFTIGFFGLFAYVFFAYFGSIILHLLLSKIFRINADDYLITTTAFIYSPPFVPVIAAAMKNKDVIITGITVGIMGYVLGNYLGVMIGYFLKSL